MDMFLCCSTDDGDGLSGLPQDHAHQFTEPRGGTPVPASGVLAHQELAALKLSALRRRALNADANEAMMEASDDSSDPKAALIELVTQLETRRGEAGTVADVTARLGEGGVAAALLLDCLEHCAGVLQAVAAVVQRSARRELRDLSNRIEESIDLMDDSWCDGLRRCGSADRELLASLVVRANGISVGDESGPVATISELLDHLLDRCGNDALQSLLLIKDGGARPRDDDAVLRALQVLSPTLFIIARRRPLERF